MLTVGMRAMLIWQKSSHFSKKITGKMMQKLQVAMATVMLPTTGHVSTVV